jgi:ABC-type antimicrobial peptide transport system permease subunit
VNGRNKSDVEKSYITNQLLCLKIISKLHTFIDDLYNKTYSAEQKTGTILNIFSLLSIYVACLGLFGLATYTGEQRTKEICIKKVLGANVI